MTPQTTLAAKAKANSCDLLAPSHAEWASAEETLLPLEPTPLERQPSAYVQKSWESRPHVATSSIRLRALLTDDSLVLRLAWVAEQPVEAITDNNVYADACGVLFPLDGENAELSSMGSEASPVQSWYWRAGLSAPFVVTAKGLGTVTRERESALVANAEWRDGEWSVVFARPLDVDGVPLVRGAEVPVGLAVWSGEAGERAGLKSHTPVWHRLTIA